MSLEHEGEDRGDHEEDRRAGDQLKGTCTTLTHYQPKCTEEEREHSQPIDVICQLHKRPTVTIVRDEDYDSLSWRDQKP